MWFSLGGIAVVPQAGLAFAQRYQPVDAVSQDRLAGGGLAQQVAWRKLATEISGEGIYPPALDSLDYNVAMTLLCCGPVSRYGAGTSIALPAARRTDAGFTPQGYAAVVEAGGDSVHDVRLVPTDLVMTGDTATLTAVPGAVHYQASYWPALQVFATRPEVDHGIQPAGGRIRWLLRAEEI